MIYFFIYIFLFFFSKKIMIFIFATFATLFDCSQWENKMFLLEFLSSAGEGGISISVSRKNTFINTWVAASVATEE